MSRSRDVAAFLALALLWGLTVSATEVGLASLPPLLLSALRYDVGGVVLLAWVGLRYDGWLPATRRDLVAVSAGGVFWIAVGNGVWFVGQDLTTSVLSGLMTSLIPIATAAVSWVVVPGDRLSATALAGLVVSFAGAVLLAWPGDPATLDPHLVGTALMLLGVGGAAVGGVLIRWAAAPLAAPAQTAWATLLGAGLIHVFSHLAGEQWAASDLTMPALGALLYLGLVGTAVGYVLFFRLLATHSAIEVSLVTYLVPVVAAGVGWLAFDEPIGAHMVAGFLVVFVGFVLMKHRELRDELGI